MLALGSLTSTVGCAKVGELKAKKAFKAANQAYQQQDYKKAAELYEETDRGRPDTPTAPAYFFLGNSYDNQYKPSKKGEPANDALLTKAVENYQIAAEKLAASAEPGRQEARQAVARVSGRGLRRRQAERPGQGRAGRAEDDSARTGRADQLLRPREDLRGRRRLRRGREDAASRPRTPSRAIRRST